MKSGSIDNYETFKSFTCIPHQFPGKFQPVPVFSGGRKGGGCRMRVETLNTYIYVIMSF